MAARSVLSIQYLTFSKRAYSSKVNKNVAFLGLGNMGKYMAANLVKQVRILNVDLIFVFNVSTDNVPG